MIQLDEAFVEKYFAVKKEYNALLKTMKFAKQSGLSEESCVPIQRARKKALESLESLNDSVIELLEENRTNIATLNENWALIMYDGEKNRVVNAEPVILKDLNILERDLSCEKMLNRKDLDRLLPLVINEEELNRYKQELSEAYKEGIYKYLGVDVDYDSAPHHKYSSIVISCHAVKRWIERIIGIKNPSAIRDYQLECEEQVKNDILSSFNSSEKEYVGETESYYFNKNKNIFFVVKEGVIVTLYINDFGFKENINRAITLKQLQVVKNTQKELVRKEIFANTNIHRLNRQIDRTRLQIKKAEDQLAKLKKERLEMEARAQARIDALKAKSNGFEEKKREIKVKIDAEKANLQKETDKIFKKWKPLGD